MKIGIDTTCWSNPRGYGRYARGLISALLVEPDGHDYTLFVDSHTAAQWPLPERAAVVSVTTAEAPSAAATASSRRSLSDLWAMRQAVQQTTIELLFYPSVYTFFPVRTKAKTVLGLHDVIAEQYPALIFPDRRQRYLWQFKSWLARRQADYIVAVSDHARDGIAGQFGIEPAKIWVVGEAADAAFRPIPYSAALTQLLARFGLDSTSRYIVCLGGLNPHKNLDTLLKVFAELTAEQQFLNVELMFIGPTEEDSFTPGAADIRQLVNELGLETAVHFTGYLPDEEVAGLLSAATLLAMPSMNEGFGLGAVEAAACGTAVIATQNSPLPRLLKGGGLFIDPHNPAELKAALRDLLNNQSKRQDMAATALDQAQKLTWSAAAAQFRLLLEEIERNP